MTKKIKSKRNFSFGKMFEVQLLYKNIFFLAFITCIGIAYIANGHRAEKKVRKIQKMQQEIAKSKFQYWESGATVEFEKLQSQTEKRVDDLGLKSGEGSLKIIEKEANTEDEK